MPVTEPKPKRTRQNRREVDPNRRTSPTRHTRASAFVRAWLASDERAPETRSQTDLAARFAAAGHKVSQVSISNIVNGRLTTTPRMSTMQAFADVLSVPLDWWLTDADPGEPTTSAAD
jgi:hypothetical protein